MFTRVRWCRTYATARWFRAVDVPARKPNIYNYVAVKRAKEYEAFSPEDSAAIEHAYKTRKKECPVETDGLMTVCLDTFRCRPTYYDGFEYSVRRHIWFERNGTKLSPVSVELEEQLEGNFGHGCVVGAHFHFEGQKFVCTKEGASSTKQVPLGGNWLNSTTTYVRGADDGVLEHRPGCVPRRKDHLIFCVHGIGQLLSVSFEQVNFVNDVNKLRSAMLESDLGGNVQVLPVMWRQKLSDEIRGIRPQQLFGTRNLAADAALDFVLYMEPNNRKRILEVVRKEMIRMYRDFCKTENLVLHDERKSQVATAPADRQPQEVKLQEGNLPKVSIIGHSLGSVLAYDLVKKDLPFEIHNLFTLGSPLGVLELLQSSNITKGRAKNMYNIMRMADPVASRMEPLVTKEALNFPPKQMVSEGIIGKVTSLFSNESKEPALNALHGFNRHSRLDFSVPESMDLSLVLGLAGHLMYLDNPDVVKFILEELNAS